MNYPKKVNRKRRQKQKAETLNGGMTVVAGMVTLPGSDKPTRYYPKRVLQFKPGTAAVVGVSLVMQDTAVEELPPLAPPCEARA
jgi:hypothetical protein